MALSRDVRASSYSPSAKCVAPKSEKACAERGSSVTAYFSALFRCLELSARECAQAKQVQGAEMLRKFIQYLAAERLGLRIPALAIGRIRGRNDRVRLLLQFLLQSRVLERARAGAAALQGFSPEDARDDSS